MKTSEARMLEFPYGTLVAGILFIMAGGFTLSRHFLLEPTSKNYPRCPNWLRFIMFLFGSILVLYGLQYIWVFVSNKPDTIPPQASSPMQFMALCLCINQGSLFLNIVMQRCSEKVWTKLERINSLLLCKDQKHPKIGLNFSR